MATLLWRSPHAFFFKSLWSFVFRFVVVGLSRRVVLGATLPKHTFSGAKSARIIIDYY